MNTPGYFLKIIQKLPHRGVGTKQGKKAAKLIFKEYKKLGLNPVIQKYKSVKNTWIIYWLQYMGFVISVLLLLFNGFSLLSIVAFIIAILIAYEILDLIPFYIWLMPAKTQNVFVEIKPKNKPKKTIVVLGHYDTPRWTWLIPYVKNIIKGSFKRNQIKKPGFFSGPLAFAPIITLINLSLFFLTPFRIITIVMSSLFFLIMFIYTFVMIGTAVAPYVPGAFDNGSGTSVVMSLASYISKNKPKNTQLYFVNSGSEETIYKGIMEFVKRLNLDKDNTYFINLDGVGADILYLIKGEAFLRGGVLYYDKELYSAAESLLKNKKYSNFIESILPMATDARRLVEKKYRVICTLCSTYKDGNVDQYHQIDDTIEKINFKTLDLCQEFVIDLIKKFD